MAERRNLVSAHVLSHFKRSLTECAALTVENLVNAVVGSGTVTTTEILAKVQPACVMPSRVRAVLSMRVM